MARTATKKSAAKPCRKPAKTTRAAPAAAKIKKSVGAQAAKSQVAKVTKATKKPAVVKAPMVSKDELRDQVEKLTASLTAVRTKNREANKELKAAHARIAELEKQVGKSSSSVATPVSDEPKLGAKTGRKSKASIEAASDEPKVSKPAGGAKRGRKPRQVKEITVDELFEESGNGSEAETGHRSVELNDSEVDETDGQPNE
jgi:hypothetical protein